MLDSALSLFICIPYSAWMRSGYCVYRRCQTSFVAYLFSLLEELTDEVDGDLTLRVIPLSCAEHFHAVLMSCGVVRLPILPITVVLQWAAVCIYKLPFFFYVIYSDECSEKATWGDVVGKKGVGCLIFRHGQYSSSVSAVHHGFSVILLFFDNIVEFFIRLPDTCYNFKGEK